MLADLAVEPSRADLIDLSVQCLNGEGCSLNVSGSCTGLEVYRMVSHQLPARKGAKLRLHHLDSPLILHKALQEQSIMGKTATLSCTYVPTDLCVAWRAVQGQGLPVSEAELALEGVTQIALDHDLKGLTLPCSLQTLTFGDYFNQSLEGVALPSSLRTLTFGSEFNQSLEGVALPNCLESLTFSDKFNQSLEGVTLPKSSEDCLGESLMLSSVGNRHRMSSSEDSSAESLLPGFD